MGVRADHAVAGADQPFFRQKGVLYAHLPHVEEIGNLVFLRETAHLTALFRRLDVLVRGKVIQHQRDFISVKNRGSAAFFKLVDRHRRSDVVAEHKVELRLDQLSGFQMLQSGVRGQDFLRHRHSHRNILLSFVRIVVLTVRRRLRPIH